MHLMGRSHEHRVYSHQAPISSLWLAPGGGLFGVFVERRFNLRGAGEQPRTLPEFLFSKAGLLILFVSAAPASYPIWVA